MPAGPVATFKPSHAAEGAPATFAAWAADTVMYRPGGGESVFDMARRIDAFYVDLLHAMPDAAAVVCHAGTIRLLAARARGLGPLAMAQLAGAHPHAIAYGEVVVLDGV